VVWGKSRSNVAAVDAAQAACTVGKGGGTNPLELCPANTVQVLERVKFSQET
jgi:hypothetical protein